MKNIIKFIKEDQWDDSRAKACEHMFSVLNEYIDYKSEKENKDWDYITFETSIKKSDINDIAVKFVKGCDNLDWTEVDYEDHFDPICIYVNKFKEPLLNIRERDGKFILTIKKFCKRYYEKNIKK